MHRDSAFVCVLMPKRSAATGGDTTTPLPDAHTQLLATYSATLTAACFLAPKGVPCTLGRLAPTVHGMSRLTLTAEHLQMMAGIDSNLALRYAVGADGESELELVVRESMRTMMTHGAVRSRIKRFRSLLDKHAAATATALPLAPLPPPPAGLQPRASSPVQEHGGRSGSSSGDAVGLPSPPPRPLRHASLSATSPPPRSSTEGIAMAAAATGGRLEAAAGSLMDATPSGVGGTAPAHALSMTERFLRQLRGSPFLKDQVVHYHEQSARPAAYATPRISLAPAVVALLEASGRTRLYSHQARAIEALLGGGHVMLCTPTASGKSLGYNIPTLHTMATNGAARAIYLFPTKALAQDQLRALRALSNAGGTSLFGLPVHSYDGPNPNPNPDPDPDP